MKICVGGTFNILHKGHKIILKKAFENAGKEGTVYIGLAEGNLVKNKVKTKDFDIRIKNLKNYLKKEGYTNQAIIVPIDNKYGLTLDEDFDAIVISPETEKIALEINKKRAQKDKKHIKIIKVPFVLADDGKPISSTRINNEQIDENGHILDRD
jgi:pantetheine-phosphate adenylyltransferase